MDEIFENISIDCPATKTDDLIMQGQHFSQSRFSGKELKYSIYLKDFYIEISTEKKVVMGLDVDRDYYLYYLNFSSN